MGLKCHWFAEDRNRAGQAVRACPWAHTSEEKSRERPPWAAGPTRAERRATKALDAVQSIPCSHVQSGLEIAAYPDVGSQSGRHFAEGDHAVNRPEAPMAAPDCDERGTYRLRVMQSAGKNRALAPPRNAFAAIEKFSCGVETGRAERCPSTAPGRRSILREDFSSSAWRGAYRGDAEGRCWRIVRGKGFLVGPQGSLTQKNPTPKNLVGSQKSSEPAMDRFRQGGGGGHEHCRNAGNGRRQTCSTRGVFR